MSAAQKVVIRDCLQESDSRAVREVLRSSGFFYEEEIVVAEELVQERRVRGEASGYHFLFADCAERAAGPPRTVGFACYGPIALTQGSYDLFWLAVHEQARHGGLGSMLLEASERRIAGMGGRRVYIETSSRPLYEPTRAFYLRRGYRVEATLEEFYGPGDGKVIFVKVLEPPAGQAATAPPASVRATSCAGRTEPSLPR